MALAACLLGVMVLFAFGLYTYTIAIGYLAKELHLSDATVGFLGASPLLGQLPIALIGGMAVDRLGPVPVLTASAAAGVGLLVVAAYSALQPAPLFAIGLLIGLSVSSLSAVATKLAVIYFPFKRRGLVTSLGMAGITVGLFIDATLLPRVLQSQGWKGALLLMAILMAGVAAAAAAGIALLTRGLPRHVTAGVTTTLGKQPGFWRAVSRREVVNLNLVGFTFGVMALTVLVFFIPFVRSRLSLSLVEAGNLLALTQLGGSLARPTIGGLSDLLGRSLRYPLFLLIALVAAGMVFLFTATGPALPGFARNTFFIVFGVVAYGWVGLYYALFSQLVPAQFAGSAAGLGSTSNQAGTAFGPLAVGSFADFTGSLAFAIQAAAALHALVVLAALAMLFKRSPPVDQRRFDHAG